MYLDCVDQLTRDDIAAAAAAHSELGRDYDSAVAEGLVERIGAEIDKRVDARLGQFGPGNHLPAPAPVPAPGASPAHRTNSASVCLALGSLGMGVLASAAVLNGGALAHGNPPGQILLVAVIWIIIGIINVVYARRN
jgi:hypothetical protein